MFKMDDKTGRQETFRGDSYEFTVTGIPADWEAYYAVFNIETQEILLEVQSTKEDGKDKIFVSAEESDKLVVPQGKKSMTYGWAIKRKKNGYEDTTIIKDGEAEDITKIVVLPKRAEGSVNG